MKKKIYILSALLLVLASSCEQHLADLPDTPDAADKIPVQLSLSLSEALQTETGYEPMSPRADETVKAVVTNEFKVIVAKYINSKWIIDQIFDYKINPMGGSMDKHSITDATTLRPVELMLTPGQYKVSVLTGKGSVTQNLDLAPGVVAEDPGSSQPPLWAYTYRFNQGFLNINEAGLSEEIFAGNTEFTVYKTQDLHSNQLINAGQIQLSRKVGKLRFLLKERTETNPGENVDQNGDGRVRFTENPTQDFFITHNNGIVARLDIAEPGKKFVSGLDVWGDPQYSHYIDPKFETTLYYGAFTWKGFKAGDDGGNYLVPMIFNSSQTTIFFFTEEGVDFPLIISDVEVSVNDRMPTYVYDGNITGLTLKHNTQTGLVFKSGNWAWEVDEYVGSMVSTYTFRELLLEKDALGNPVSPENAFGYYYENRQPLPGESSN